MKWWRGEVVRSGGVVADYASGGAPAAPATLSRRTVTGTRSSMTLPSMSMMSPASAGAAAQRCRRRGRRAAVAAAARCCCGRGPGAPAPALRSFASAGAHRSGASERTAEEGVVAARIGLCGAARSGSVSLAATRMQGDRAVVGGRQKCRRGAQKRNSCDGHTLALLHSVACDRRLGCGSLGASLSAGTCHSLSSLVAPRAPPCRSRM